MTEYEGLPQLPQNVWAEEACLGSCIIDPEAIFIIAPFLSVADFYIEKNGWIYNALRAIVARNEPVDFVTLCDELERSERLAEVGGAAYITRLINAVPSAIHVERYAQIVESASERRRVLRAASGIAQLCYREELDRDSFQEQSNNLLDGAMSDGARADAVCASDSVHRLYAQADEWARNPLKPGEVRGLSTGISDLDSMLHGIKEGFYLVGAVQHTGKTAFVQQIFSNVGAQGLPALFFSMEHSADYMFMRMASALSGIGIVDIERGLNNDGGELTRFNDALAQIGQWPLEIMEGARTLPQIANEVRARDLALVVVENLEITAGGTPGSKDYIQYRNAAYGLLNIAQKNHVPVFSTMQAGTKMAEQREDYVIELADLYGSDGPSMAATVTLLLHRPDRWTFNGSEKTNTIDVACWKDKANHVASGHGRTLQFWHQGQIRNKDNRQPPVDF